MEIMWLKSDVLKSQVWRVALMFSSRFKFKFMRIRSEYCIDSQLNMNRLHKCIIYTYITCTDNLLNVFTNWFMNKSWYGYSGSLLTDDIILFYRTRKYRYSRWTFATWGVFCLVSLSLAIRCSARRPLISGNECCPLLIPTPEFLVPSSTLALG